MKVIEKLILVVSILSFFLLLIAININIELDDLFYYLGGTHHEVNNSIDGIFRLSFLFLLSCTNLVLVSGLFLYKKNILYSSLCFVANTTFFFLNFNLTQYRIFQGFSYDPEINSYLQASRGDGLGYLFVGGADIVMYMIILFYLSILIFQRYKIE